MALLDRTPEPAPGNKFILGWIRLRKGTEDEFDRLSQSYLETCRAEPECRFFYMLRTREDPNMVLVCECFVSEDAHKVHLSKPHVAAFFEVLGQMATFGEFENVLAASVNLDSHNFAARTA